jgi:hypothetical protein
MQHLFLMRTLFLIPECTQTAFPLKNDTMLIDPQPPVPPPKQTADLHLGLLTNSLRMSDLKIKGSPDSHPVSDRTSNKCLQVSCPVCPACMPPCLEL